MKDIIYDEINVPAQLKKYFQNTKVEYDNFDIEVLHDIEEAYILYDSLYYFDDSDFSKCVIDILKKGYTSKNFNYFLLKTLDKELLITSKNVYNYTFDSISTLDYLFDETVIKFIKIINSLEKEISDINIESIYKQVGMVELINMIVDNEDYKTIYNEGVNIIESKKQ